MSLVADLSEWFSRIIRDRAGGVITYAAILTPILCGAAGLSVDVSSWYLNQKVLVASADAGAMSGALELMRNGGSYQAAVIASAAKNGYKIGQDPVPVINNPPLTGSRAGATDSVEVILTRKVHSTLSSVLGIGDQTIVARAVAYATGNNTCVWSLNPNVSGAVTVSGGADVNLDCGMVINSKNTNALDQSGSSCIHAAEAKIVGGYSGDCVDPTPSTGVPPVEDPLSWLVPPTYTSCDYNNPIKVNTGQTKTLDPGVYCAGISVQSGGYLNFNPGLYILVTKGMTFNSGAVVRGYDVNFYLSEFNGSSGTINIAAGADVELVAGANGGLDGVLFFHDPNSPSGVSHTIAGGSTMNLDGILYFPNQNVKFAGGSSGDATHTILIADTVTFTGNTTVNLSGAASSANPALVSAKLAE